MAKKNIGKRIGFVDYRLGNYHANVYLDLFRGDLKNRGYTVAGCWALDAKIGTAWAAEKDVPWFDTPKELDANVDNYIVLAPSNPEKHLELCREVFPFGKSTYVDKTFAQDLVTAKKIFALADKHKVRLQTTSALRYTSVQEYAKEVGRAKVKHMVAWGGGRSFGEYAIHPTELVVSCMGAKAERLTRRGKGKNSQLLIDFSGGRTAVINVYTKADTPFAASVTTPTETRIFTVDAASIFRDTASAILDLFATNKPSIDRRESLLIRRVLDAADDPKALSGWVTL